MKLKSKLKAVLAAVTFAFAGTAAADINSGNTFPGNGELFLSVWNTTLNQSYTRDLGISFYDFLPTGTTAPVNSGAVDFAWNPTTAPAVGAGNVLTPGYQLAWGADPTGPNALLNTLLATSGTIWSVIANDNIAGTNGKQLLFTSNSAAPVVNNSQLGTATANIITYVNNVNGTATQIGAATTAANYSSVNSPSAPFSYAGSTNFSTNLGIFAFNTTATVGTGLDFWFATDADATTAGINFTGGEWLLANDGTLSWNVAQVSAPIPEPGTWAMLMAGLAMVGGIARRRTKV